MIEYYLELPENSKKLVATRNEHEKTSRETRRDEFMETFQRRDEIRSQEIKIS